MCEVDVRGLAKVYEVGEPSLRGTKLEVQGPVLWARNLARAARLTAAPAGRLQALAGVDVRVRRGEVFGLIGRNGSGKTTLIKILAGLLRPTAGEGCVAGVPLRHPAAIRARVSYVSTTGWMALEWPLTAEENVRWFGVLCGLDGATARRRAEEALRAVDLWADRGKYSAQLSNGMRQRVVLARALLLPTPVVLLDEPTIGLDPHTARLMLGLIRDHLRARGQAVVLTDHVSAELEAVADRVAVLDRGRVVLCDSPGALTAALAHLTVLDIHTEEAEPPSAPPPAAVRLVHAVERPGPVPTRVWRIHAERGSDVLATVLDWVLAAAGPDARVVLVAESRPSLEDAVRFALSEHAGVQPGVGA